MSDKVKKILKLVIFSIITLGLFIGGIIYAINTDYLVSQYNKSLSQPIAIGLPSTVEVFGSYIAPTIIIWFGFAAAAIYTSIIVVDFIKELKNNNSSTNFESSSNSDEEVAKKEKKDKKEKATTSYEINKE